MKKDKKIMTQPMIRHASLFGTVLLSSTTILPGITAVAAEQMDDTKANTTSDTAQANEVTEAKPLTISSVDGASEWTENTDPLLLTLNLDAHSPEHLDATIRVSANAQVTASSNETSVKDETGRDIGSYTVDNATNEVKLTFTEKQFTKAVVTLPVTFKKADLSEQKVVFSVGDSMVSKTVATIANPTEEISEVAATTDSEQPTSTENETSTSDDVKKAESTTNTTEDSEKVFSTTTQTEESSTSSSQSVETTESSNQSTQESTTETSKDEATNESSTETTQENTSSSETAESTTADEPKKENIEEAELSEDIIIPKARMAAPRASSSQTAFIESVGSYARTVAASNDLYASVMIAQAILESGYGTSTLSSAPNYNLFGIKGSYNGQSVTMPTQEYYNGQYVTVNAAFRKYPSYRESLEDNARVLKTTSFSPGVYFYAGAWKSRTNSYMDATKWLTGRYATDPNYNTKLNNLIVTYNLTQYDSGTSGGSVSKPVVTNPGSTNNNSQASGTYTVKSGDTLYKIAMMYGMTVQELKSLNGLSSDLIRVGQQLKVSGGTTSSSGSTSSNNSGSSNSNTNNSNSSNSNVNASGTYTVKSGDTLYKIAMTYGISVQDLKKLNGLTSDTIYVGQKLKVSGKASSSNSSNSSSSNSTSSTSTSSSGTYIVKSGDTLYQIALTYGMSVQDLKKLNGLTSDIIQVGQKLKVSGKASSSNSSSSNTSSTTSTTTATHTVKSGDTLYGIGLKYGLSVQEIKSLNNLSSDVIHIGQTLKVSKKGSSTTSNTTSVSTGTSKTHVVKSGDTLYGIGLRYNVSINDIKKWNNLTSDVIHVGQSLKIGSSSNATKTVATSTNSKGSYTVKSGDSLYKIALENNTTVQSLKQTNKLSSDFIYVGQKLAIAGTSANTASKNTRHTVKAGDSLWILAKKYNTSVAQIKAWNNLKSDVIYANQVLRVS